MVKNKDCQTAHPQSGLSLSLSLPLSPMPFMLMVPLDPAEAGPQQVS